MSAVIPSPVPLLYWLVLKVLRDQVQLSIAEPKPIEDHRHRSFPDTHTSTGVSCLFIQPLRYSRFLTHPSYYPQMIQTLCLVLYFLRHFLALPRFFSPYRKSFFPSTLLRNVGSLMQ